MYRTIHFEMWLILFFHVRMVFNCSICGRPTHSRRALDDHERAHGDERIVCDVYGCNRSYQSNSELQRHFVNVHEPQILQHLPQLNVFTRESKESKSYLIESIHRSIQMHPMHWNFYKFNQSSPKWASHAWINRWQWSKNITKNSWHCLWYLFGRFFLQASLVNAISPSVNDVLPKHIHQSITYGDSQFINIH